MAPGGAVSPTARPFLAPTVGTKLMRDPSVVRGPDGQFHMVWTTGWWDQGFGVAHSADLRTWSPQSFVPVLDGTPGVQNVWAPEIHYDSARGGVPRRVVLDDSRPLSRDGCRAATSGRAVGSTIACTRSLRKTSSTWTPARLFYDGGFSVIDGVVVQDGDRAVLVMKDETRYPEPRKHLRVATAARMSGPFGAASAAFTPDWVEGPTLLRLGDVWRIYYDEYTRKRYGAMDTRDFRTFTPVADVTFPDGMRHGTAFAVPRSVADALDR